MAYRGASLDWVQVAAGVQRGDQIYMGMLYNEVFQKEVRAAVVNQLASDIDDHVHDMFLATVQEVQAGKLREPDHLIGFIHAIMHHQICVAIKKRVECRSKISVTYAELPWKGRTPEQVILNNDKSAGFWAVFNKLNNRDREILIRFYINEESSHQIMGAMHLTETTFRLLKSRAKARFGEMGKRLFRIGDDKSPIKC